MVDGWIYCSNIDLEYIYKMRTDGTQRTKLTDDDAYFMNVVDGWIYYINHSDGYLLTVVPNLNW